MKGEVKYTILKFVFYMNFALAVDNKDKLFISDFLLLHLENKAKKN